MNKRTESSGTVASCPYCDEVYPDEEILTLHEGIDHYGRLPEREREAFEEAYEREQSALRTYQLKALLALVLIYFGFIFVYQVFT